MDLKLALVMKAACLAASAHARQKRKVSGDPYVNHLIRVAHDAALAGLDSEAVAAALLHDVVDDTSWTIEDLTEEFPAHVVELVRLLTKWWPDDADKETKRQEKPKYYGAISDNQEAIELKLLDRADNLRDMTQMLPREIKWAERYLAKTQTEISPLLARSKNEKVKEIYEKALAGLSTDLQKALKSSRD